MEMRKTIITTYRIEVEEWYSNRMLWELEIMRIFFPGKENSGSCFGQGKFNSFYDNIRSTNQPNRPTAKHFQYFETNNTIIT